MLSREGIILCKQRNRNWILVHLYINMQKREWQKNRLYNAFIFMGRKLKGETRLHDHFVEKRNVCLYKATVILNYSKRTLICSYAISTQLPLEMWLRNWLSWLRHWLCMSISSHPSPLSTPADLPPIKQLMDLLLWLLDQAKFSHQTNNWRKKFFEPHYLSWRESHWLSRNCVGLSCKGSAHLQWFGAPP